MSRRNPKVMIGYPFGTFEPEFVHSLLRLQKWDGENRRMLSHPDSLCAVQTTNVADGRNKIVKVFLESDADWLWFVDTDQQFDFDVLDRMVDSADPKERPILSALVMARRPERRPFAVQPACILLTDDDPPRPVAPNFISPDRHWQVAAVGCGCVLIHRSVLEQVGEKHKQSPWPWFEYSPWTNPKGEPDIIGEDYTFCFKAASLGHTSWVDTSIVVGHIKSVNFSTPQFWGQFPTLDGVPSKTFAVIPVKDQLPYTKNLLKRLHEQGGVDQIFVIDNGSGAETRRWLAKQTYATVIPMPGAGIHEMWNAGAATCLAQWPVANIALLNNDLEPGPAMLATMANDLRSSEFAAICPNYDGRPGEGIERVHSICAGHYYDPSTGRCGKDGCEDEHFGGGLAGFAMMIRGEVFRGGYRFPEECKWWYGDNDLTLFLDANELPYGMTHKTTVKHLDGGGRTGKWDDDPKMKAQIDEDRANFLARVQGMYAA